MRDPERLSAGGGVTDFERTLLDAARNEELPDALRQRMERALGLSGGAGGAGSSPARVRTEAVASFKASTVVWISAGVVALGFVGGVVGARFGGPVAPAVIGAPAVAPSPPIVPGATPLAPAPVASEPSPVAAMRMPASVPRASSRPVPPRPTPTSRWAAAPAVAPARRPMSPSPSPLSVSSSPSSRSASPSSPSSSPSPSSLPSSARNGDLRVEIELIDHARAALRAGSTTRALEILSRYAARFPQGALEPEGVALRVEALVRVGRTVEARALARRFVGENPASPLVDRLERLVGRN